MPKTEKSRSNILLRMHPLQRIMLSVLFAGAVWFGIRNIHESSLFIVVSTWSAFAFSYLITSWFVIFTRGITEIKRFAQKEDGSRVFVLIFAVVSSFAAIITVLLLVINSDKNTTDQIITVPVSFLSVLFSWALVHTILTFHYAHLYYDDDQDGGKPHRGGLDFPEKDDPDYVDFAYFSFVIGMTFQVSDVEITDKKMRRLVLAHGLISFLLNTFVVALTVNFIAGLKK